MRRLLPLALFLVACAKPVETSKADAAGTPTPASPAASADLTPEGVAKSADVPLYPGAEAPENMSAMPDHRSDGSTHYSLVLATPDSLEKVTTWYVGKLALSSKPMGGGQTIIGKTPKGNDLIVTIAPEAGRTMIRIKSIAYGH